MNMDALIEHVKTAAAQADEAGRKKIMDELRDLSISIEAGYDSMQRIMYSQFHLLGARVGTDLKLFKILVESEGPQTAAQLAEKTGADPIFLARLLRYLASVRQIEETAIDAFRANKVTQTLATPGFQAGVNHFFSCIGPVLQDTPAFLAENKYQNPSDPLRLPFQRAFQTDLLLFRYMQTRPDLVGYFNTLMTAQRGDLPGWLSVYPIEEETRGWNPEEPVFVDIGGGVGHQCLELKTKFPELPGKIFLEDLPIAIDNAVPLKGLRTIVHDFFTPQPIEGAKYYYLRNILHDYPDDRSQIILKNIREAMGPDSCILIDDMVLPEQGVHWQATQLDLVMMLLLGARERTELEWKSLLASVGLKAKRIYPYTQSLRDSIIVAVPV